MCDALDSSGIGENLKILQNFNRPMILDGISGSRSYMFNDHTKPLKVVINLKNFIREFVEESFIDEIRQHFTSMVTDHLYNNFSVVGDFAFCFGSVDYICNTVPGVLSKVSDTFIQHGRKMYPIVYTIMFVNCNHKIYLAFKKKYPAIIDSDRPYVTYILKSPYIEYQDITSSADMDIEAYSSGLYHTAIYFMDEQHAIYFIAKLGDFSWKLDIVYYESDHKIIVFFENLNQFFKFKSVFHDIPNLTLTLNPFKYQAEIDSMFDP